VQLGIATVSSQVSSVYPNDEQDVSQRIVVVVVEVVVVTVVVVIMVVVVTGQDGTQFPSVSILSEAELQHFE